MTTSLKHFSKQSTVEHGVLKMLIFFITLEFMYDQNFSRSHETDTECSDENDL